MIKFNSLLHFFINFSFFLFYSFISFSQVIGTNDRPSLDFIELNSDPLIDGDVINDTVWQNIPFVDQMIQTKPSFGLNSSERTEIKVAFTSSFMYIGVVCYDSNPDKLLVSDSRRDADLGDDDSFLFIIDTYNDQQNGFLFGTNSAGMQYDAQIDNEGEGNRSASRQQSGVIGGTNLNWDVAWVVSTKILENGWSAEFAIPLKSIRFSSGINKTWGINFQRNISKNNEVSYWAPLPAGYNFNIKRVSLAGKLNGISLRSPGNLKLLPYILTKGTYNVVNEKHSSKLDYGVDLKYSINSGLTLDLTYNTDFAQAEVDKQQVNIDRFNLFYPEKRAFFLENAGQFSVGSPGEVDLFFSRRIGISENGSIVPIIGGGRLSGKVGNTNIGVLSMLTDNSNEIPLNKNVFNVARINHNFESSRSSLGGIYVSRDGVGQGVQNDYNRVFALDGVWGIGKKAKVSGFLSKSFTPGIEDRDYAYKIAANYDWNLWRLLASITTIGEGFNPEVGYLERNSFKKPQFMIWKTIRFDDSKKLLEVRPHIYSRTYWDFTGNLVSSWLHIDNHWEWRSGLEIHTGINLTKELVFENFNISDLTINSSKYNHAEAQIVFITNPNKKISLNNRSFIGGYFGGFRVSNNFTLNIRPGDKFNSSIFINSNNFRLDNGNLDAVISGLDLSFSFTPKMFIQSLIQYNNITNLFSLNARFGLIREANSGLYVVFNILKDDDIIDSTNYQQITIKYTHTFDLIR